MSLFRFFLEKYAPNFPPYDDRDPSKKDSTRSLDLLKSRLGKSAFNAELNVAAKNQGISNGLRYDRDTEWGYEFWWDSQYQVGPAKHKVVHALWLPLQDHTQAWLYKKDSWKEDERRGRWETRGHYEYTHGFIDGKYASMSIWVNDPSVYVNYTRRVSKEESSTKKFHRLNYDDQDQVTAVRAAVTGMLQKHSGLLSLDKK